MIKNKIILIVILLVGLIAISTVNAEEISNETSDLETEVIDDSIIESSDDDCMEDSADGTFTDLSNEIANAEEELNLTRNYVCSYGDYNYGIKINKKIIINGNGFTINGNNQALAFYISYDNIVLKNINFINCINSMGGAIHWSSNNGTLYNCSFINCYSSSSYSEDAGAIYWGGDNGILYNCNFMNSSSSGTIFNGYGVAISWNGNNGTVFGCSFNNCSRFGKSYDDNGGTVYWGGDNGILYNCSFTNCYSSISNSQYACDVHWKGSNGILFDCNFINCSISSYCSGNSGFIYWSGDNGILINCSFINCFISNSDYNTDHLIFWKGNNGTLYNCSFINFNGYVVSWYGDDGILFNCSFINCYNVNYSYAIWGGVIDWGGDNGTLYNCSFINCYSANCNIYGGIIYWAGNNGTLYNCSFINCYSTNSSNVRGGIIYWYWAANNGTLYNCSFINCYSINSSNIYGSIVYLDGCNGILYNCSFVNCFGSSSSNLGGVIDWGGDNGTLFGCSFINCSNSIRTIMIYWNGNNGTLFDCNFNQETYNWTKYIISNNKLHPKISMLINNTNVNFGETIDIYFSTNELSNNIEVYIDNIYRYNITDENLKINNLNVGVHIIKFIYNGDSLFSSFEIEKNITIEKSNAELLNITVTNKNDVEIIFEFKENTIGNVSLNINNTILNTTIYDNKAIFICNELFKGNYNITLNYFGDINHNSTTFYFTINIPLKESNLKCFINNNYAHEEINVNYSLNNNATGNISIYVDNIFIKNISLGDNIQLSNLMAGNYTIRLKYSGDDYYESSEYTTKFEIYQISSIINITCEYIYLDEIATIDYNITNGTTGVLSVYLNDTFIKNVTVGNKIKLDNLKAGKYLVKVKYNSDGYYESCEDTTVLVVYKLWASYYSNEEVYFVAGDNENIDFYFDSDMVGVVNISFGKWNNDGEWISQHNYSSKLNNGVASITVSKLTGGVHDLIINYGGSDRFDTGMWDDSINVEYKNSPITLNIDDVNWGDSINIKPTLPDGATGNITVLIDNKDICNMTVGESYKYNALIGGKHTLTIKYNGDEYYSSNETTIDFNVAKLDSTFSIENTFDANPYITIPITLANDASGNITVTINNKDYKGTIINGTFNFTVYNLGGGSHNAIINYTGDNKYNSMYLAKEITVNLKKSTITTDITNILTGNDLVLKPTVTTDATGTVSVYVDNTLKTTINVGSSYTISKPSIGKHEVRLVYNGNSYFESSEFSSVFRVFTIYPIVTVDTQIIPNTNNYFKAKLYNEYGEILSNKYVLFNVGGSDYTVETNNDGIATLNIDLPVGEYDVTTVNMLVNENTTNKLLVFHSVVADNIITESGDVEFKATFLDESAKALSNTYVVFIVDGDKQSVRTDVNGIATLKLSLTSGTHTITSINTWTDENTTNKVRIVSSIDSIVNMAVTNVSYTGSSRLTINVDSSYLDADVIVTVTGDNGYSNVFSQKASKSIVKQLTGLNAGKYDVDVKYESTDGFTIQLNDTFTVFKINPEIIINCGNIYVGQTGMINVSVGNSNGSVTVKIGSKTFEKQLINGTASINVDNLVVGSYSVDVIFNGDNNYNPLIKSYDFTISKIPTNINVLSYYSEWGNGLSINLTASANGKVTVKVYTIYDGEIEEVDEKTITVEANQIYEVNLDSYFEGGQEYDVNITFTPSNSNYESSFFMDSIDIGDFYPPEEEPVAYKIAFFNNQTTIILYPDDIEWGVKNVTVTEYDAYYDESFECEHTLSTFKINNIEYMIIHTRPTSGLYGDRVCVEFNPEEYNCYDGIFYKMENGNITDIISDNEYFVLDNVYYKPVGRMGGLYNLNEEIIYCIVDNECYKFIDSATDYVIGFFTKAMKGTDYNIVNGQYYTLNGEPIRSFYNTFFDMEDEEADINNDDAIINGVFYNSYDGIHYYGYGTRYSISPYNYIKVNGIFYRLISGEGTFNTTEEYDGEIYNITLNNKYALINNQLFNIENNVISSTVNLTTTHSINTTTSIATTLTSTNVNMVYNEAKSIVITLKDSNGNKLVNQLITIKIDGKTYNRVTNGNGQATFTVNLLPKSYSVDINYAGVINKYVGSKTSAKFIIIKATPKLTTAKKSYKTKVKTKKYTVTLKDNKGKTIKKAKLTLKIKGKTYKATTNAKGQATFKITKLTKKGTYKSTVKFAGNSYYNVITKSVKIVVKK